MTVQTRTNLQTRADEIRDETVTDANTALRVGGWDRDLLDSLLLTAELVRAATVVSTSDIATLSGLTTTVDSVLLNNSGYHKVLLTGQTDASENGPWEVQSGPWTRPGWFASGSNAAGVSVVVYAGTTYHDTVWFCTSDEPSTVVDTNDLAWQQMPSDESGYLLIDGTRAMTGDLDVGGNDVTNVGLVDGRDVNAEVSNTDAGLMPIVGGAGEVAYSTGSAIDYAGSVKIASGEAALEVHGTGAVATTGAVRTSKDNGALYARNEADSGDIHIAGKDTSGDNANIGSGTELARWEDDAYQMLDAHVAPDAPTADAFRLYSLSSGEAWVVDKAGDREQLNF